jgi:hypothetical protein
MGKIKGSYTLGVTFDVNSQKPIDSRMRVEYLSDLTKEYTWQIVEGDSTKSIYDGMMVVVMYEGESGKKPCGDVWVLPKADKWNVFDNGTVSTNGGWKLIGGDNVPAEQHKLLYSYDDKTLTPNYLKTEGFYVVDNQEDFDECAGKKPVTPNIINEWQQYSDRAFMPEYGNGYSETQGQHVGKVKYDSTHKYDLGIGYGHWRSDEDLNIYNDVNSFDYNGYINPRRTKRFNCITVVGTDKGGTTGDWAGYALIDDSKAHPRRIECSDGNTYYRNTLYDLPYEKRLSETVNGITRNDLWCAWVNEDKGKGFAYIIYSAQVKGNEEFSEGYVDEFPQGDVKIYKSNKIKTHEDRVTLDSDVNYLTTHVEGTYDAYGYVVTLNILTQNTTGINLLNSDLNLNKETPLAGNSIMYFDANGNITTKENGEGFYDDFNYVDHSFGTVIIFTNVIPCGSDMIRNNIDLHLNADKITIDSKDDIISKSNTQYYVPNSDYQCYLVYPYGLRRWVKYDDNGVEKVGYLLATGEDWYRCYGPDKLYGEDLVKFDINALLVDGNGNEMTPSLDANQDNRYSFIRSNIYFNNGVLTLQFSDVDGQTGTVLTDKSYLNTETLDTNLPLNGSKLVIDFNNGTVDLTPYNGHSGIDDVLNTKFGKNVNISTRINDLSTLPYAIHTYNIKDKDGNIVPTEINVFDSFKGEVKFMYIAQSMAHLLYRCNWLSFEDRLILDVNRNEVHKYNPVKNEYEKVVNELPVDYFTGSRISYNEITEKLWYSNGTKITQIANNCSCREGENGEGGVAQTMVFITHDELLNLRNTNQLIPGVQYRIIDYITTTTQQDTKSVNHQFDIIAFADDESTLNENVRFIQHSGDTYFDNCNLDAWEGKYCIDNDITRFAWADETNGKGVIYYLKDEWGNECPYDFKNIQFKRVAISNIEATGLTSDMLSELQTRFVYDNNGGICYGQVNQWGNYRPSNVSNGGTTINYTFDDSVENWYYTFTWVDENNDIQDASIVGQQLTNDEGQYSGVFNNQIQPVSQYMFYPDSPTEFGYSLNNIVFVSSYSFEDGPFYGYYGNTFGVNCYNNTFGNSCYQNTFGNYFQYNTFGNYCDSNTFGNGCYGNTFGNSCYNNTFGNNCNYNTFGNGYYQNTFGNDFQYNTFGNYFQYNTFGNNCYNNTFGNYCYGNTFGNNCWGNIIEDDFFCFNTFENGVSYCSISGNITSDSNYLQNIIVLNGTKGVYGSLLDLSGLTVGADYHQACGFNSDGVYTVKNLLDDGSCEGENDDIINQDRDVVSVIIPKYEGNIEPENPSIGDYWFSTSDGETGLLYKYSYVKYADEEQFELTNYAIKLINQNKTFLFVYNSSKEVWEAQTGVSTRIYLTTNTNEMLSWSDSLQKFVSFEDKDNILNNAIHFTAVNGVYTEDEIPDATDSNGDFILVEDEYGYFILYKKHLQLGSNDNKYWEKTIKNDLLIKFNVDENNRVFQKVEYEDTIVYEEITNDIFQENINYINDNNGDVYAWNGVELIKLSSDILNDILPNSTTFTVNFNSSHDENQKLFISFDDNNAISENSNISTYQVDGNHTVIAVNAETGNQTLFDLRIHHDDDFVYQTLYNNDVVYTRHKYLHNDLSIWSAWEPKFLKTNICLDIQQETLHIPHEEVVTDSVEDDTYTTMFVMETDKYIKIKLNSQDEEFIKINENFLTIRFYRKKNRRHVNKWRFIGKRQNERHEIIPHIITQNGDEYYELSFKLSECTRNINSSLYTLPFTLKELMNGLILCRGSVYFNNEDIEVNDLYGVMKYGTKDVIVRKVSFSTSHSMKTYGYDKQFRIHPEVFSSPSISNFIGINLVFGIGTNGENYNCTEIIPYKCKVFGKRNMFEFNSIRQRCMEISYNINNVLTKNII